MKMEKKAIVPQGWHNGSIKAAREVQKDFNKKTESGEKVMEPVVEIVIAPEYSAPGGGKVLDLNVLFTPNLDGISAFSRFLARLGINIEDGEEFQPSRLEKQRVHFEVFRDRNGFMKIKKETISKA